MSRVERSGGLLFLVLALSSAAVSCGADNDTEPGGAGSTDASPRGTDQPEPESCEPACVGNTACFAGLLCQSEGVDLGGACGGTLAFPDPECDACVRESCCADLQGCFGDENAASATPCAEHYACVVGASADCSDAATFEAFEACTNRQCNANAEQQNAVDALRSCAMDCGCD